MRVERLARAKQQTRLRSLAESLRSVARGISVEADGTAVVLRGRGLLRRWLSDSALRFSIRLDR